MAQRHPRNTPNSNPHGTPPPTQHARQQSPWHSATHATRPPAIRMAQRHPSDPPTSNPHGTAPHTPHTRRARDADPHGTAAPTRPAQQQSPWHSATHGTRATSAAFLNEPFWLARTPAPTRTSTATRLWSAIPKTRRHPDEALGSNPQDTAPPTRHAH